MTETTQMAMIGELRKGLLKINPDNQNRSRLQTRSANHPAMRSELLPQTPWKDSGYQGVNEPWISTDVTPDDERSANMFRALEQFAAQSQVMVFTHHHHLLGIATNAVGTDGVKIHRLLK